jgi:hypothetical protein
MVKYRSRGIFRKISENEKLCELVQASRGSVVPVASYEGDPRHREFSLPECGFDSADGYGNRRQGQRVGDNPDETQTSREVSVVGAGVHDDGRKVAMVIFVAANEKISVLIESREVSAERVDVNDKSYENALDDRRETGPFDGIEIAPAGKQVGIRRCQRTILIRCGSASWEAAVVVQRYYGPR